MGFMQLRWASTAILLAGLIGATAPQAAEIIIRCKGVEERSAAGESLRKRQRERHYVFEDRSLVLGRGGMKVLATEWSTNQIEVVVEQGIDPRTRHRRLTIDRLTGKVHDHTEREPKRAGGPPPTTDFNGRCARTERLF